MSLRAVLLGVALLLSGSAAATNNVYSETSHTLFGVAVGSACTWGADVVWPEHRALLGFGLAASLGLIEQSTSKGGFSAVDAGANALGGAIGAFLTDRFLLAPVVRRDAAHSYLGLVMAKRF